jgi:XTP/dITP diphosphohydrolase
MMAAKRVVIASHNRAKSREIRQILLEGLRDLPVEVGLLADYADAPVPEEIGATYVANAVLKARACAQFTGEIALADDAGLEVDALNGLPGLHSRRFEGNQRRSRSKWASCWSVCVASPTSDARHGSVARCDCHASRRAVHL